MPIEKFAVDLRKFILKVRRKTCGNDKAALKAFRVYLVAHSMGGLICRSYLQKICRKGTGDSELDRRLELKARPADTLVDKVFTYATPHNGIDFFGLNVPDLGPLSLFHAGNFDRETMAGYLGFDEDEDPPDRVDSLNRAFPPLERFFCLVGTNYGDYDAFYGLSRRATGPMSDGLVMISNATVQKAPRAFVHRTHSGHYGIVNSEEGYQNLRRFLFGNVRVDALLEASEVTLPKALQKIRDEDASKPPNQRRKIRGSYHIDVSAKVRGAGYHLHERRTDQASALLMGYDELVSQKKAAYLFSGYLTRAALMPKASSRSLAFAIRLVIYVPLFEVDRRFWFDEHFEGARVLDNTLYLEVNERATPPTVRYRRESGEGTADRLHRTEVQEVNGSCEVRIPIGFAAHLRKDRKPHPGFSGALRLVVAPWNSRPKTSSAK